MPTVPYGGSYERKFPLMVVNLVTISCTLIAWTIVGIRCRRQMFTESGGYWLLLGALTGITAAHVLLPQDVELFGAAVITTAFASMLLSLCLVRLQSGSWEDEHWSAMLSLMGSLSGSLGILIIVTNQLLTLTEVSVLAALLVGLASFGIVQYRPGRAGQET